MADSDELLEMRCRCCGVFLGWRRRIGRFVFWCSEDCADSTMAKWEESQPRDEVIVELYLQGIGVMEISRLLDDWPYQYVQQTLARRGLQFKVKEHIKYREHAKEIAQERRVLVRQH
jgi:hypothetical protein